jgi:hypothetical protein
MSDFESICASTPVWGEGSDSGEAYSNVPVFPDRVWEFNMSLDVPKSESIARGINLPSSHVNKTFPGLRSRCNMVFSCFWDSQHSDPLTDGTLTKKASPDVISRNKPFTSSALSR